MNCLETAQNIMSEEWMDGVLVYEPNEKTTREAVAYALIAIAEELKKANELHSYFEEAMKEDKDVDEG